MRDRLLIRHFLWRFLEHDLISPSTDRRGVLSASAGLLMGFSLFAAVLVAAPYQFNNEMPPGIASLRSMDDRALFVSMSMLVMALAAVSAWDALTLDIRDAAVLGTLPIPHRLIVRSKLAATGVFALGVLIAWNVSPTLLRAVALPAGLGLGWLAVLRLTGGHAIATCSAGLFGFLTVLGSREAVCALVGPARFRLISTPLQAVLLTVLTTSLLVLPGQTYNVGPRWLSSDQRVARLLPPLWFVGLHEALTGSVIDDLPRTRPPRYLARQEQSATVVYRSLRPGFPRFAAAAFAALLFAATTAASTSLWNTRRLPSGAAAPLASPGRIRRLAAWLASRVVARTPLQEAGFFFAAQSIWRCASHRITMAAAIATAVAVMIVAGFGPALVITRASSISVPLLGVQSLVIGIVLTGFRYASRLPSELRGRTTFVLAWPNAPEPFVEGVKRAGWIVLVLPILTVMAIWHIGVLGLRLALLHTGFGAAVGTLMIDALFFHNRRVPFVSMYTPSDNATAVGVLYGAALLTSAFGGALLERAAFEVPLFYIGLLATVLAVSIGLRWFDRLSRTATIGLDVDEQGSLPTQRFSLSG